MLRAPAPMRAAATALTMTGTLRARTAIRACGMAGVELGAGDDAVAVRVERRDRHRDRLCDHQRDRLGAGLRRLKRHPGRGRLLLSGEGGGEGEEDHAGFPGRSRLASP